MPDIEPELIKYIREKLPTAGAGGLQVDEPLLATGRLDSLGLLQVLTFVEQRWGVDIFNLGEPEDFATVASLARAVRRHGGR